MGRGGSWGEVLQIEGWSQQETPPADVRILQQPQDCLQSLQDACSVNDICQRLLVEMEGLPPGGGCTAVTQSALHIPEEVVASLPICRNACLAARGQPTAAHHHPAVQHPCSEPETTARACVLLTYPKTDETYLTVSQGRGTFKPKPSRSCNDPSMETSAANLDDPEILGNTQECGHHIIG
ncbi:nesprin-1-like protein [Lates japonicus]|uniref:Nesprin-1-like protein n=1 Tax=Lates japonicus TaxID=270547 RepID=A0AAD3M8E5_LATJO|nr:nesprin-1-like protein [Lates japonicus]